MQHEVGAKLALVQGLLERRGLAAVVLNGPGPVAWLTGGLTNRIEPGSPASPLWLVVTGAGAAALTTNVERPRLEAESGLTALEIELHEAPWYEPGALERLAEELAGVPRARIGGLGVDVDDDLVELRLALSPARDGTPRVARRRRGPGARDRPPGVARRASATSACRRASPSSSSAPARSAPA